MFNKRVRNWYNLIFNSKISFKYPKKNKILVFDKEFSKIGCKILGLKKYETLHVRKEEICLPILIGLIFKFKLNSLNYYKKYIEITDPKIVLTFIDNNYVFYKLKKYFISKTFISIQNGHRMAFGDIFGFLKQYKIKDKLSANMIFTFNKNIAKKYKRVISSEYSFIGSIRNNHIKKKVFAKKKRRGLVYISTYRSVLSNISKNFLSLEDNEERFGKKYKLKYRQGINFDIPKILKRYCFENKEKLIILGSSKSLEEKNFYDKLLGPASYKFIYKKGVFSNYTEIDKSNLIVSTFSTLGYEAFARGKKICFFSPKISKFEKSYIFGWPYLKNSKGFFYSNEISYGSVSKILDNIKKISRAKWLKKTSSIQKNLMLYNKNNSLIKTYIKNKLI